MLFENAFKSGEVRESVCQWQELAARPWIHCVLYANYPQSHILREQSSFNEVRIIQCIGAFSLLKNLTTTFDDDLDKTSGLSIIETLSSVSRDLSWQGPPLTGNFQKQVGWGTGLGSTMTMSMTTTLFSFSMLFLSSSPVPKYLLVETEADVKEKEKPQPRTEDCKQDLHHKMQNYE